MRLITIRDQIRAVPTRWRRQYQYYPPESDKAEIGRKLDALDLETVSVAEIDRIIGNDSWTELKCDECEKKVDVLVRLGNDEPDYDAHLFDICAGCLRTALSKVTP